MSVASAVVMAGGTIARFSVDGQRRRRAAAAPAGGRGPRARQAAGTRLRPRAAGELAIEGAQPLRFNAYKVPLMRNLVKRAIRGVEA